MKKSMVMMSIVLALALVAAIPGAGRAQSSRNFKITTVTYSGNAIGMPKSVGGYRASYYQQRQEGGANSYTMYGFETAGTAGSKEAARLAGPAGLFPVYGYGVRLRRSSGRHG